MKNQIWQILCKHFFQIFIKRKSIVVDFGAGYCEFINNIQASKKYAVDMNPDTKKFADSSIVVVSDSIFAIKNIPKESVDVVFMSNFLEHMKNKDEVIQVLESAFSLLKTNGKIIILQPNIKYAFREYWDFFDHHTPLTDKSLCEALTVCGFSIEKVIDRFLPFSTKSKLPKGPIFVRLYLLLPIVWKIFGKQALVIGVRRKTIISSI